MFLFARVLGSTAKTARELCMEAAPYSGVIKVLKDAEFIAVQKRIVAMAGKGEVHALKSFLRKRGPDSDLLPGCDVNAALPKSGRSALMAAALANQVCAHQHAHT